jgi:hypothetical protein
MPKRLKNPSRDPNRLARQLVDLTTDVDGPEPEPEAVLGVSREAVSEYMAHIGRRGGRKGGKRRLQTMTPEQRSAVALKAARARWKKEKAKKRA